MREIVVTCGRLQMGKSSLAHSQARQHKGEFVFDPTYAFDCGLVVKTGAELVAAVDADETPIVFHSEREPETDFAVFAQTVRLYRNVGIVVDEASLLCSPHYLSPDLGRLIREVARFEHGLYITTHRPADLNPLPFSLADKYQFFQTTNALDLTRIAAMTSDEAAERVKSLAPRHYLEWRVAEESFWVNADPESWRPAPPIKSLGRRSQGEADGRRSAPQFA